MISETSQSLLKEFRCQDCSKLLFKGILVESEIEIKCKRCGKINTFAGELENKYLCYVYPCPHRVTIHTD